MAEQPASTTESSTAIENDAGNADFFSAFLRDYRPSVKPVTYDVLEERYQIDLSKPLTRLNTKTAEAYEARDNQEPNRKLYALVCHNSTIPRLSTIRVLQATTHPCIMNLIAAGLVPLSQNSETRYVIIHEQPSGQTLAQFLEKRPGMDEYYIISQILSPLAEAISHLQGLGLTHGRINPDNVYFTDKAMLGECVSEPCGYSQPFYFETLERMQAYPAAKGSSNNPDFYALGVLLAYTLFGAKHFANISKETLMHLIFREGTYHAIIRNQPHPEAFGDFLRGVLHDDPDDRWNWKQLRPWLNGRHFNVLVPPSPTANIRPFEYMDKQAYTRRELAEHLFRDWVNIPAALKDKQFMHWLGVSLKNKPLAEQIERIIDVLNQLTVKQELQFNEQLMRILILLDPQGPIRMSPLAFFPDGLGWLYLDYFKNQDEKEMNLLLHFMEQNMLLFWVNLRNTGKDKGEEPEIDRYDALHNIIARLDKMRLCLRNRGVGFGSERILYEMNPSLPCQSPLVQGKYITDAKGLMIELDRIASTLQNKKNAIDNHIFGFLACKLGLQNNIRLRELEHIPDLAENRDCIALRIFGMAQYRCGNVRLPGLSHWIGLQLLPVFDRLKSRSVRKEVRARLKESATTGQMHTMAKEIIDSALLGQDSLGYNHAINRYHFNTRQITSMRKGEQLQFRSNQLGLSLAKYASYLMFVVTLVTVMRGGGL